MHFNDVELSEDQYFRNVDGCMEMHVKGIIDCTCRHDQNTTAILQ